MKKWSHSLRQQCLPVFIIEPLNSLDNISKKYSSPQLLVYPQHWLTASLWAPNRFLSSIEIDCNGYVFLCSGKRANNEMNVDFYRFNARYVNICLGDYFSALFPFTFEGNFKTIREILLRLNLVNKCVFCDSFYQLRATLHLFDYS